MPTTESTQLLCEILDRAFNQTSWHGPNLRSSIRGVSVGMASKILPGRKSIWQQVLHAAYWKQRVLNKLAGRQPFPRQGSNWPKMPETISERAWREDVALLEEIHQKLRAMVETINPKKLGNQKLRMMIYGAAMHDVYHAGQIRLSRKMLRDMA